MIEAVRLTLNMPQRADVAGQGIATSLLCCHLRHMNLAATSTLQLFAYMARITRAKTHSEAMRLSKDYLQTQKDISNCRADCVTDFVGEIVLQTAKPFRTQAIVASSVIL